jgi:cobalt/nickel transport system ATP-binding protein
MNGGVLVADGPTPALLADGALMAANRLELPFGFDPSFLQQAARR